VHGELGAKFETLGLFLGDELEEVCVSKRCRRSVTCLGKKRRRTCLLASRVVCPPQQAESTVACSDMQRFLASASPLSDHVAVVVTNQLDVTELENHSWTVYMRRMIVFWMPEACFG
jgi:hypothetical protein